MLTLTSPCIASVAGAVIRFHQFSQSSVWETMPVLSLGCVIQPFVYAFFCPTSKLTRNSISIVELNIALSCNCITTLFSLFKDLRKRPGYLRFKRYLTSRNAHGISDKSGEEKQPKETLDKLDHDIPNPIMTGLRSFIRRIHNPTSLGSTKLSTAFTDITDVSAEAEAAESQLTVDYHNQLKAMR
jgi:hypothetical protein